ncbi:MAG TPA: ribonuclease III [Lachnoclostridium sp.]|nr:ribonuclease III [Lachnoclostridium sp.]
MSKNLKELEERIDYRFSDRRLMTQAMTHSSYANEHRLNKLECNERLEFLGDSVLEVVSSDCLYHKYPERPEGDLTKIRASIVCEPTLAYCAEDIRLGEYLLLGRGEEATGGRGRASIVSDAMEALIGAIYLDGGFANAKEFILRFIMNDLEHKQLFYDSKTILQEIVQSKTEEPLSYELLREEGPDHNNVFEAQVLIGQEIIGQGTGRTKKAAEQVAAYHGILSLKNMETPCGHPSMSREHGQ